MIEDVIKARRSVRRFKSECPSREQLLRLIEAAVAAPSASNKQPWRFLVISNRGVIAELAVAVRAAVDGIARCIEPESEASFRAYGNYFTRFEDAPVVIAVLFRSLTLLSHLAGEGLPSGDREQIRKMERDSGLIGAAMAMQNLLLMATDTGLGASGMTGPLVAGGEIRRILDISPSWELAAFIPVGFPAEEPPPVERKAAERVAIWIE